MPSFEETGAPRPQTVPSTPTRPGEKGTSRPQIGGSTLDAEVVPTRRTWNEERGGKLKPNR